MSWVLMKCCWQGTDKAFLQHLFSGGKGHHKYSRKNNELTLCQIHISGDQPDKLSLTHWGPVTHICVSKLTIIGSDNGLLPGRRQAIIWTNAGIFLIGSLGIDFSEILIAIQTFSFKKMHLKISSAKWRPFCLGPIVLTHGGWDEMADIFQTTFSNTFSWMKCSNFN